MITKGREHRAAWTVALGSQEREINILSRRVKLFLCVARYAMGRREQIPRKIMRRLLRTEALGMRSKSRAVPIIPNRRGSNMTVHKMDICFSV